MRVESLKGDRLRRAERPSGPEAAAVGLRASNVVLSSPWIKRPLVARSSMSAASGRWCEGKWSHIEAGKGLGHPSRRYRRVESQRGSSRCACSQSLWL